MKVAPVSHAQPGPQANGMHPKQPTSIARLILLGLLTAGFGGQGYWAYNNHQSHARELASLTQELDQNRSTIHDLRNTLQQEQENDARNIANLTQELEQSRSTIQNLRNTIQQDRTAMSQLSTRINELNQELGTRITLDQVVTAISMVTPSTVRVEGKWGLGSGVIMIGQNGERYILTNGHVTENNEFERGEFRDSVYHIKIYNGTDYENPIEFDAAPVMLSNGQRAYSNPNQHDLALLAIPPDVKLPPGLGVRMRDITRNPLRVGEPVIAVGNPFGERDSVTVGSISHIDRESSLNINHHIQTDAPINPGNSGGGLFSIRVENGKLVVELVGINTWGYRGGDGIGGSIRVDYIQKVFRDWGINI